MGKLSTHVLDTARGNPAQGISIILLHERDGRWIKVAEAVTNADGRCDRAILEGDAFVAGEYEIQFLAGPYLEATGQSAPGRKFLDTIVIRFGVADAGAHYHVPLLLQPFGYTTYRGS